jgi:ADP-ribose pyrophosphatase YjhB (NUDIX family)
MNHIDLPDDQATVEGTPRMNFCSQCGDTVKLLIPDGDNLPRHVCQRCGTIHYVNPKLVVGCIAEWQDQILLCRRSIAPRYGLWTLPAGFMENDETTQEAAARETWEEANARVRVGDLYTLFNLVHINQIYLFFRGELIEPGFAAGKESLEVKLFAREEIPWEMLAFAVIRKTLEFHFADRERGDYPLRMQDIRAADPRFFQPKPL